MPCKVLIVTPDIRLADATRAGLRRRNIEASTCTRAEAAIDICREREPDAIVVDLELPHLSATDFCRFLRTYTFTPVLVIGPQDSDEEGRVLLGLGAESFHNKPLAPRHLTGLIVQLLERRGLACGEHQRRRLHVGNLEIDLDGGEVHTNGTFVRLTPIELGLLQHLASAQGHILSGEFLLNRVWDGKSVGAQTLHGHMARLRRKLDALPACSVTLTTIPGTGYALLSATHAA